MKTINKKLMGLMLGVAVVGVANAGTMTAATAPMNTNPAVVANNQQVLAASNGIAGPSGLSMLVISQGLASPQVKINLNSPANLVVYDQSGRVAFTQQLPAGVTTVDTTNFPLGNDMMVVTVNQAGSTFTMKQAVTVTTPMSSGS